MFEQLVGKLTKNYNEIPLFYVTFNLNKFKEHGEKGSCNVKVHPSIGNDEQVRNKINELIDYIRENHDMEDLI